MSSNPPHPFSPIHRRTTHQASLADGGRWTVDNSESRFYSIRAAQSPSRSILRGPSTPLRYGQSSQEKRNELLSRRVSFARDAHLRVFDQNDSPDVTSRDIPNLFEESQPDFIDNAFNSPASNLLLSNSIGSPSDRKRRPDLFGSPKAVQKSPKRRAGGAPPSLLVRMYDEDDEAADLTRYLSVQPGNNRRNIFEEDDDEEEEEEEQSSPVPKPIVQKTVPQHIPERIPINITESTPERITQHIPQRTPERIPVQSMLQRIPNRISEYNLERNVKHNSEYNPEQTVEYDSEHALEYNLERTPDHFPEIHSNYTLERHMEDQTDDMIITQEIHHSHAEPIGEESSIPFIEEETMLITQEMPPIFDSTLDTPRRFSPQRSSYTPDRNNIRSNFSRPAYTPNANTSIPERGDTLSSPDRNGSTPQRSTYTPNQNRYTPERIQQTPIYNDSPHRLSVLTPLRENHAVYSEQRSFLLHQGTPLTNSQFNNTNTVELDNVFDVDNNDIMEEEYSQLYNTLHDIPVPPRTMTLSEFLTYAGISFPDDTPARDLRRRSHFNADYGAATDADQVLAAALTLPELNFYKKEIEDLHGLIHKSQDVIDKIDKQISETNPQFFAEYLDSDYTIRTKTEKRFKEIKTYAALKAIQQWYTIWICSLKSLPVILQENLDKLQIDKEVIPKFQQKIKPKFEEINAYKEKLDNVLKAYRLEEEEYDKIDHEKLDSYEQEIGHQRLAIQDLTAEAELLEAQEKNLLDLDTTLDAELVRLEGEIQKAETTIESNKCVTVDQLMEEKDLFERNSEIGGWKMEKPEDDIIHMGLEHNIDVTINQTKLANKQSDAVLIRMLESKDRSLGPLAELIHGLTVIAHDKWEIDEIMQDIAIYWNRVMLILRDLSHVQRRFWIEIEPLENAQDAKDAGISCHICAYSFIGKTKFTVGFHVKPKDVMEYPAIDISTLTLVVHYGGVDHDELKNIIEKELSSHGINDIVDTLIGVLERIAIPE